jgi:XRE family transcriptional regulator, regulator of sulfur utilization
MWRETRGRFMFAEYLGTATFDLWQSSTIYRRLTKVRGLREREINVISRRDIAIAAVAVLSTVCLIGRAQPTPTQSAVFNLDSIPPKRTESGSVRLLFKGRTATLDSLDIHVTTLDPGKAPHPPHKHLNEELLIIKEGTLEVLENGETKRAGPGSVVLITVNQLHGIRNPGPGTVTYYVVGWISQRS